MVEPTKLTVPFSLKPSNERILLALVSTQNRTKRNEVKAGNCLLEPTTSCHYLRRPHVEAVHNLADVRYGFQRCGVDCIRLGIVENDEASSTLI